MLCSCDTKNYDPKDFDPPEYFATIVVDSDYAITQIVDFHCSNCGDYIEQFPINRIYLKGTQDD
jgi:hypothetical protein